MRKLQRFLLITLCGTIIFFIFKLKHNINIGPLAKHNPALIGLDLEDQAKLDQWVNKQEKLYGEPFFNNGDTGITDDNYYHDYWHNLPDHQTTNIP